MGLPACMFANPAEPNSRPTTTAFTPIQRPTCRTTTPPAGPHQNRSKHSHISERCATGTKLWPLALAHPRQRAAIAGMGRTWPSSNRSMQSSPGQCGHIPCAGHCPSTLRASGALFGAVSLALRARERTRMLLTGGNDKIGQPASRRPPICASPRCCASIHRPCEWPS